MDNSPHRTIIVKVRMQTAEKSPVKIGAVRTAVDVCKTDGVSGLYRGVSLPHLMMLGKC